VTVRRLKTYTAETGRVYQYYFVGHRPAPASFGQPATEYVFDISSDRRSVLAVSVFLLENAVGAWAERHGRMLVETERYAAAKLRLLKAFDEIENMSEVNGIPIGPEELDELLEPLDL